MRDSWEIVGLLPKSFSNHLSSDSFTLPAPYCALSSWLTCAQQVFNGVLNGVLNGVFILASWGRGGGSSGSGGGGGGGERRRRRQHSSRALGVYLGEYLGHLRVEALLANVRQRSALSASRALSTMTCLVVRQQSETKVQFEVRLAHSMCSTSLHRRSGPKRRSTLSNPPACHLFGSNERRRLADLHGEAALLGEAEVLSMCEAGRAGHTDRCPPLARLPASSGANKKSFPESRGLKCPFHSLVEVLILREYGAGSASKHLRRGKA